MANESAPGRRPAATGPGWRQRVSTRAELAVRETATGRALTRGEQLVRAARDLINETGSTSFTVQDIARRADTSLSTVYAYFAGKDELLLAVVEEAIRVVADDQRARLDEIHDPLERLRTAILGPLLFAAGPDRPDDVSTLSREYERLTDIFPSETQAVIDQLIDILREELTLATEAGLATPIDIQRDARSIYNLWTTHLRDIWRAQAFDDLSATADYLWDVCCRLLHIPQTRTRPTGPRASS